MGTNRYRIVTQPLILVLFAYGFFLTVRILIQGSENRKTEEFFPLRQEKLPTRFSLHPKSRLISVGILLVFLGIFAIRSDFEKMNPFAHSPDSKLFYKEGSWQNKDGKINYFLNKPIYKALEIPKEGVFDIAFRLARNFGPETQDRSFLLAINGEIIDVKDIPMKPGWVYFRKIGIEKGLQIFSLGLAKFVGEKTGPLPEKSWLALGKNIFKRGSVKVNGFKINQRNVNKNPEKTD